MAFETHMKSCQEELQTAKLQISKQNVPAAEQEETDGSEG